MASSDESEEPTSDVPTAGRQINRDGQSPSGQTPPVPTGGTGGQVLLSGCGFQERRTTHSLRGTRTSHLSRLHPIEIIFVVLVNKNNLFVILNEVLSCQ